MGISEFIIDVGRPVAFYPKLKNVTGSTTATILLCQFLYWSDKTKDGWVWKTSSQLEEETGLTENEQRTARKELEELVILSCQYMRLEHMIRFRIDKERLNALWEGKVDYSQEEDGEKEKFEDTNTCDDKEITKIENTKEKEPILPEVPKKKVVSDKETLDALEEVILSSGMRKSSRIREMENEVESKLHINTRGRKWQYFYEYAYRQETEKGWKIEKFLDWLKHKDNFDPMYCGPDKMETMYPQAFVETSAPAGENSFVAPLPSIEKEEYAPMPKELKAKINLI